jgi:hypothetical protein
MKVTIAESSFLISGKCSDVKQKTKNSIIWNTTIPVKMILSFSNWLRGGEQ